MTNLARRDDTQMMVASDDQPAASAMTLGQVTHLANIFAESQIGPKMWRNPAAATVMILTANSLGLSADQALRGMYAIDGRVGLEADLLIALCRRSSVCEYFRLIESSEKIAIWETKRRGDPSVKASFSIEDAQDMGLTSKSNWKAQPKTMLVKRAASKLARLVYQDLIFGIYTREELLDGSVDSDDTGGVVSSPPVSPTSEPPASAPTAAQSASKKSKSSKKQTRQPTTEVAGDELSPPQAQTGRDAENADAYKPQPGWASPLLMATTMDQLSDECAKLLHEMPQEMHEKIEQLYEQRAADIQG